MKQTIEINVPDGYEFDKIHEQYASGIQSLIVFKQKQQKNFSWYVDQYMHTSPTTNDEVVNWLSNDQIEKLGNCLKTNKFSLVPWEIKIGLFKFICDDNKMTWHGFSFWNAYRLGEKEFLFPLSENAAEKNKLILSILPEPLVEDLWGVKQNKN